MKVLYISYDGMTDPLGRSQVLPYLVGLSKRGHSITLLSCEKKEHAAHAKLVEEICQSGGIDWQPLRYHKRPPILSTMFDLDAIRRRAAALQKRIGFDLVHCRSYLPAMVGLQLKRRFGVPFLFDMRGFWIEERVEMGLWDLGNPIYRVVHRHFKSVERRLFAEADAIVSLTEEAKSEMRNWPGGERRIEDIEVIPCCVDFAHFDPRGSEARAKGRDLLGIGPDVPLLLYLGSLGGNYLLPEMLDFFRHYRRSNKGARFLFVTHHDPKDIERQSAMRDVSAEELIIRPASREDVPPLVAAADVGIAFKRPSYSSKACSPTKIGEMLAMGVPVVANLGVGDTELVFASGRAGAAVEAFDEQSLSDAAARLEKQGAPCDSIRAEAIQWFDLDKGIDRYDSIYRAVALT